MERLSTSSVVGLSRIGYSEIMGGLPGFQCQIESVEVDTS